MPRYISGAAFICAIVCGAAFCAAALHAVMIIVFHDAWRCVSHLARYDSQTESSSRHETHASEHQTTIDTDARGAHGIPMTLRCQNDT